MMNKKINMVKQNISNNIFKTYEKNNEKIEPINDLEDFWSYLHMCNYLGIKTLMKNMFEYLIKNSIKTKDFIILHEFYKNTSPELLNQIRYINNTTKNNICGILATYGYTKCLQYAKDFGQKWTINTSFDAIMNGHFECFMYLIQNGCPCNFDSCIEEAIFSKKMNIVYFIYEKCNKTNKKIVLEAARSGSVEILKFLIEKGFELDEESYLKTIERGNLSCVKYFHTNFFRKITSKHIDLANFHKRLNVSKYFEENQSDIIQNSEDVEEQIIELNSEKISEPTLKHSKQSFINEKYENSKAALNLLKETLKINSPSKESSPKISTPITNNCSNQQNNCSNQENNYSNQEKYDSNQENLDNNCNSEKKSNYNNELIINHIELNKKLTKDAALTNDYQKLLCLIKNGCPIDKIVIEISSKNGWIDILKLCVENKVPMNIQLCNIALKFKHKKCLEYLIEKKCPGHNLFIKPLNEMQ